MNVKQTKRTILGCPPRKSILILANHGVGKSEMIAQCAAEKSLIINKPVHVIDFRLAQCEVGDLIGMMRHVEQAEVTSIVYRDGVKSEETSTVVNATVHDLAEWFPTDPDWIGYLFLDELFRAPRDLQNAVMELSLDYRYHFRSLPMGCTVISAANHNMDLYSGAFPDPAQFDRWLKIYLKPTVPEWMAQAEKCGVHRAITTYINKFPTDLGLDNEKIEIGITGPSPRAWFQLSDWIKHMASQGSDPLEDNDYLMLLSKGYVGDTICINFAEFVRVNYQVFRAEDILNKFTDEMETAFKGMLVTEITFYNSELTKHLKGTKKISAKQSENLLKYVKAIPKEAASGFWASFAAESKELAAKWYREQAGAQEYIYGFLSKKMATA
jgi:hypothetical protein